MIYIMQNLETNQRLIVQALNEIDAFGVACENPVEVSSWIVADEYPTDYYLSHEKEIQDVLCKKEKN